MNFGKIRKQHNDYNTVAKQRNYQILNRVSEPYEVIEILIIINIRVIHLVKKQVQN